MESSPPSLMPTPRSPASAGLPRQAGAPGLGSSVNARALPEGTGHRITPSSESCSPLWGCYVSELWIMIHFLTYLNLSFSLYWDIVDLQCVSFGCICVCVHAQSRTTLQPHGL